VKKIILMSLIIVLALGFAIQARAQYVPAGLIGYAIGGWRGVGAAIGGVALTRLIYSRRAQPEVVRYEIVNQTQQSPADIDYVALAKKTADEMERRKQAEALEKLKEKNLSRFERLMDSLLLQRDQMAEQTTDEEYICYALCGGYGGDGILNARPIISRSRDRSVGFEGLVSQCSAGLVFWDLRNAADEHGVSYQHLMIGHTESVCRNRASNQEARERPNNYKGVPTSKGLS
jgi:hypothetical protein